MAVNLPNATFLLFLFYFVDSSFIFSPFVLTTLIPKGKN